MKIKIESLGLPTLLGVAFVVLKLCHVINWSWWWVLAPFWIGVVIFVLVLIVSILLLMIGKGDI